MPKVLPYTRTYAIFCITIAGVMILAGCATARFNGTVVPHETDTASKQQHTSTEFHLFPVGTTRTYRFTVDASGPAAPLVAGVGTVTTTIKKHPEQPHLLKLHGRLDYDGLINQHSTVDTVFDTVSQRLQTIRERTWGLISRSSTITLDWEQHRAHYAVESSGLFRKEHRERTFRFRQQRDDYPLLDPLSAILYLTRAYCIDPNLQTMELLSSKGVTRIELEPAGEARVDFHQEKHDTHATTSWDTRVFKAHLTDGAFFIRKPMTLTLWIERSAQYVVRIYMVTEVKVLGKIRVTIWLADTDEQ